MPNTRLILHVKGTEAETAELPKDVVRAAISGGQLTYSQLIWSPVNNAWKQVRELPELLPGEHLILHVKGTEAETRELPKQAVRTAISQGKITHSQLIWSSSDNAWKQVRELPELLPSQKLAPSPSREAAMAMARAAKAIIPESPNGPVARAAAAAGTPAVKAGAPDLARSNRSFVVKEDDSFHPFKWICIVLGTLILLGFGGNYLMVDHPLVSNLSQTAYSNVRVYAHLGAFIQPNVIVIHIPTSSAITPDNLSDFIVALARSTPQSPLTGDLYTRIALTSGWTAQYSFSGYSWKELGDMAQDDKAQQKEALLARMGDAGGQPLMPESTLNEAAQKAARDQVWNTFVARFAAKP